MVQYREAHPTQPFMRAFNHGVDVDRQDEKARLVFNGVDLNEHLVDVPFAMSSVWDVVRQWRQGACFITIDIRSGFYHCRVARPDRRFLVFKFRGRTYRFNRLPMGLRTSPATFCALSAEITRMLRARGLNVLVTYVDDFIIAAASVEEASLALDVVRALFHRLGFEISEDKVQVGHSIVALGVRLRSGAAGPAARPAATGVPRAQDEAVDSVSVPGVKLFSALIDVAILQLLASMGGDWGRVPAQFAQRLTGRLSWMCMTMFAGHTMMRPFYGLVHSHPLPGAGQVLRIQPSLLPALKW
jgi:hypothetical protein